MRPLPLEVKPEDGWKFVRKLVGIQYVLALGFLSTSETNEWALILVTKVNIERVAIVRY